MIITVVAIIMVFTVAAVSVWSEASRRDREAQYRHETYQKMIEHRGESTEAVMAFIRDEEQRHRRDLRERRSGGLTLSGFVTCAFGVALGLFIYFMEPQTPDPWYLIGLVPLAIGAALLYAARLVAPRPRQGHTE